MRWVSGNLNPGGLAGECPSIANWPLRELEISLSLLRMLPDPTVLLAGTHRQQGLCSPRQLDFGCLCSQMGFCPFWGFPCRNEHFERGCRALGRAGGLQNARSTALGAPRLNEGCTDLEKNHAHNSWGC